MKNFRQAVLILVFCLCAGAARADEESSAVPDYLTKNALDAVRLAVSERFEAADGMARASGSPLIRDIADWLRLTNEKADFDEPRAKAFVESHRDWPRLYLIRRNTEKNLLKKADEDTLADWFGSYPPVSTQAVLKYVAILLKDKNWEKAVPMIHNLWIKADLSDSERAEIQEKYGVLLDERDYASRLHRLLWAKKTKEADALLKGVDGELKNILQARVALIKNDDNPARYIKKIKNQNDAGLVYDTVRWLRLNKKYDEAAALLQHAAANKVEPLLWWTERAALARTCLLMKRYRDAYRLVREHGLTSGAEYADAEWFAGWISVRFLRDKKKAVAHFENMLAQVSSPVSVARGEYWLGRTHEELGRRSEAIVWYEKAAQKITTLYGQLAARKIKRKHFPDLPEQLEISPQTVDKIKDDDLYKAVLVFNAVKEPSLAEPFALRLYGKMNSPEEITALAYMLKTQANRPDLAVDIARRARQSGVYFIDLSYPVISVPDSPVEQAITLSIIRQESGFAPHVVSPAGARGLMQVMPSTAKHIMRLKRLDPKKLNSDPDWNVTVGTKYFNYLLKRFDGSYVLAIAAYNAGPGNVSKWVKLYGKPDGQFNTIDWIEMIPFAETRNYVLRVLENLHVYRRRMNYDPELLSVWEKVDSPEN